jgi:Cu2+-exporting ATPase
VDDVVNHPGLGIEGRMNGRRVRIGSPAFASGVNGRPLPNELLFAADEVTVAVLADEQGYLAMFTFGDRVRPGARQLVRELEAGGRTVCLLSGDRRATVEHVARELGIRTAVWESTPDFKLEYVRGLQARGAVVAMVGDGVNDAPVLAQAQLSIAMGGGTDLAHASADMVLVADDLFSLSAAFDTAGRAMRIIRQNLAWAAAYNAVAIPLAVAGLVTPVVAGVGMALSSLAVVANALRLQPAAVLRKPPAARRNAGGGALAAR